MGDVFGMTGGGMEEARDRVPQSVVDTRGMAGGAAFELWREQLNAMGEARSLRPVASGFHVQVEAFQIGPLVLGRSIQPAQTFDRSRFRIARDGLDQLVLRFFDRGSVFCRDRDADAGVRPGDLFVTDLAEVQRTAIPDIDSLTLVVPRAELEARLGTVDGLDMTVIRRDNALVGLFQDHLAAVMRAAPGMTVAEAGLLVGPTLDLAVAAIRGAVPEVGRSSVQAALVDAICRHIRVHARDPGLSPAALGRLFGISERKLSYLFAELGGVASYIGHQRLLLARRALTDPAQVDRTVERIAEDHGFAHRNSFARAFERAFGMTPGQYRQVSSARTLAREGKSESWHAWIGRFA